ncbi:hypothetical protein HK098_005269 [Nowakowskiella sp. JEL0407]|nr:hypothetical protein HK098_005269 [Nowakowskiella sp. JEL0407]
MTTNFIPSWKPVIERALDANKSTPLSKFVQLATVKPNERPANRTLVFRGFYQLPDDYGDLPVSPITSTSNLLGQLSVSHTSGSIQETSTGRRTSTSSNSGKSSTILAKLTSLLMFVTDIRSSKILEDLSHNNFGEICWYFPETREQFRLSGTLHLVAQPQTSLISNHLPLWAPRDIPWEDERQRLWRKISPELRATFAGGTPGSVISDENPANNITHLEDLLPNEPVSAIPSEIRKDSSTIDLILTPDEPQNYDGKPPKMGLLARSKSINDQRHIRVHDEAFANFGLMLFDVDFVDHVDLSCVPAKRTQYKINIPERTFGRISGLTWEVKNVHP